ncbi:hypothetical protein A3J61_01500 [Candidatus Nomurabacteria bacterium RIFCSPHIGHO2_02_FULL_38_15]|uniref:Uncharacterized protein n=1 Tax=Candidatus Nomurabacteria bacterium RIFCSPHIGHO2_02_FULL_38_15 TaxID=1801752 RepID=A0A1F6VRG8_9BACT|nr:MAG: hypothetical protein A3J61_01500 [Candidatus Nomurabacteria bacterium RIFCSPHIGHO2_02_FULL_38_15]
MENTNIEHPEINNVQLENERALAEKVISNLKIQIGKNEDFLYDPAAGASELETAKAELEVLKADLVMAEAGLSNLNNAYNAELEIKLKEIETKLEGLNFEQAA